MRNETSKSNILFFFRPTPTGKTSTRMKINKTDSVKEFCDYYNGMTTSWGHLWTQFGHHSERHLINMLLAVPISFILLIPCSEVIIGYYNLSNRHYTGPMEAKLWLIINI